MVEGGVLGGFFQACFGVFGGGGQNEIKLKNMKIKSKCVDLLRFRDNSARTEFPQCMRHVLIDLLESS